MEFSKHNYDLRDNLPRNAHFWQVSLLDIVLYIHTYIHTLLARQFWLVRVNFTLQNYKPST